MSTESFDPIAYFEDRGMPYATSGKDVSRGWVGFTCPFCADHAMHGGINLTSKIFSCFLCGKKGPLPFVIRKLEGIKYDPDDVETTKIIEQFQDPLLVTRLVQPTPHSGEWRNILPPEATGEFLPMHTEFLRKRRFDPESLIQKYKLLACGHMGDYKFRVVIPIFERDRCLHFTSRDITGAAEMAYKHCPDHKAVVPIRELWYNLDSVRDKALIVEGATDVWRMGDGTIGTFGMAVTMERIIKLRQWGVKEACVMFDGEPKAIRRAREAAGALSAVIPRVYTKEPKRGDPDDLPDDLVKEVRASVFGKSA